MVLPAVDDTVASPSPRGPSTPTLPVIIVEEKPNFLLGGAAKRVTRARRVATKPSPLQEKASSKPKPVAISAAERDRRAREAAERVKALIAERDLLRPVPPTYARALRNTLELDPGPGPSPRTKRLQQGRRNSGEAADPRRQTLEEAIDSLDEQQGFQAVVPSWPYAYGSKAQDAAAPVSECASPNSRGSPTNDEGHAGHPKKPKRKQKGKRRERLRKGAKMLKSADTEKEAIEAVREGTRVMVGHLAASDQYLEGLEQCPDDDQMQGGFDAVVESIKLHEKEQTLRQWPFNARAVAAQHGGAMTSKPGRMHAPGRDGEPSVSSVGLCWENAHPQGASNASGHELEVALVNALDGQMEWRLAYRGKRTTHVVSNLGRGLTGIRARVRAYNSRGKGEWSPRSELLTLLPIPPPQRVEISEMPGSWLTIDLGGLPELSAAHTNETLLAMTKDGLVKALHANRTVIKIAFRYYALAGVSNVDDDPSTMTMIQFGNFVRGARLINNALSSSDADRIFLRSVRALPSTDKGAPASDGRPNDDAEAASLVSALPTAGVKATKEWRKAKNAVSVSALLRKGGNEMTQAQFVAALIRLTTARYPDEGLSIDVKLEGMIREQVTGHVLDELELVEDGYNKRMRTRAMGAVLEKYAEQLETIYASYAAFDRKNAEARRSLETINVLEMNELCQDIGIYDKTFTVRDMLAAFVKVNIDDDLYYQPDGSGENGNSSELDYAEFEEVLGRIYNMAVWLPTQKLAATAALLDQDGDGDLDVDDADDLFDECDSDHSGAVSVHELTAALSKRVNEGAAAGVASKLMAFADEDGSGTISRVELRGAILKLQEGGAAGKEHAEALERGFDAWLGETVLPRALAAAKKKKLLVAVL